MCTHRFVQMGGALLVCRIHLLLGGNLSLHGSLLTFLLHKVLVVGIRSQLVVIISGRTPTKNAALQRARAPGDVTYNCAATKHSRTTTRRSLCQYRHASTPATASTIYVPTGWLATYFPRARVAVVLMPDSIRATIMGGVRRVRPWDRLSLCNQHVCKLRRPMHVHTCIHYRTDHGERGIGRRQPRQTRPHIGVLDRPSPLSPRWDQHQRR